jgi:hypothetical protein
MVRSFGEWRIGGSILFTSDFVYEGLEFWEVPTDFGRLDFRSKINYRETLAQFGLTAARPFGTGWSLGITLSAQNFNYLNSMDFDTFIQGQSDLFFTRVFERRYPQRVWFYPSGH